MPTAANRPLRETTLLIGLPITEEEFGARLADSDLLARFRSTSPDSGPDADSGERRAKRSWKQYFSATAAPVSELREDAERLGARVVTRATLADFRKATAKFETVILLSHWKGPEVSFEDILRTPSTEHLRRLAWQNSPVTRRLRERLIERGLDRETGDGGPVSCTQARTALRQALNAVVQAEENFEQDDDAPVIEHPVTVRTRRRDEIDTLFSGFVRPGNRIELFDGMHDKADIETAIAPGFGGVIDLTTCTSVTIGDYIDCRRDYRIRAVSFPTTITPEWSSLCVKTALNLAASGLPYLVARDQAVRLVHDSIEQESRRRRRWLGSWLGG